MVIGERAYFLQIIFGMSCVATLLLSLGLAKLAEHANLICIREVFSSS
jgi:hypothetical protein